MNWDTPSPGTTTQNGEVGLSGMSQRLYGERGIVLKKNPSWQCLLALQDSEHHILSCSLSCRLTCMRWLHWPSGRTPTVSRWCCWSCDGSWHARKTWSFLSHPRARSTPTEPLLLLPPPPPPTTLLFCFHPFIPILRNVTFHLLPTLWQSAHTQTHTHNYT